MPFDFSQFKEPPYASELFGVYQPLLGWRSARNRQRASDEGKRITQEVVRGIDNMLRVRPELQLDPRAPYEAVRLSPLINQAVRSSLENFIRTSGEPTFKDWSRIIDSADFGEFKALGSLGSSPRDGFSRLPALGLTLASRAALSSEDLSLRAWHQIEGTELFVARELELAGTATLPKEAAEVQTLRFLSVHAPQVLETAYLKTSPLLSRWLLKLPYVDPLANFDGTVQDLFLSPVGVLHLFREYFFEGKSMAGPAVGHVWLAPGSSLELYEIHTRRRVEERRLETTLESTRRSESETTTQDELSSAVNQQNGRNTNLGVTASGGFNLGVVQSSTTASISLADTQMRAQQEARKHMRQQSERISTELRQSLQTSFRSSTEVEDTESRRYVLNNTTERLVNYELKRKMRTVGVQVQRLGAQLCWQVFVDEPGIDLGIPALVHIAKPSDLDGVPPPEAPAPLALKESKLTYDFRWRSLDEDPAQPNSETYRDGRFVVESPLPGFVPRHVHRITHRRRVNIVPPEYGYEIATVTLESVDRVDPEKDPPEVPSFGYELPSRGGRNHFWAVLREVNFHDQPSVRLNLSVVWEPSQKLVEDQETQYDQKLSEYTAGKSRAAYEAYVEAVRDRVVMAGQVLRRPSEDLREEERTIIFRHLIGRLTAAETMRSPSDRHVISELVRSLFDLDRMLYFVAPEWWNPRRTPAQQEVTAPTPGLNAALDGSALAVPASTLSDDAPVDTLGPANLVSWGGISADRESYLITEDSSPAPLGASLGWILQLDGDAHRNAFLNSPWVKAVIPIRRGFEEAALNWLERQEVEGNEGLHEVPRSPVVLGSPDQRPVRQRLLDMAEELNRDQEQADTARADDRLYENGFDPLAGGTTVREAFPVFDQWLEILPTDQIVAVEYTPGS